MLAGISGLNAETIGIGIISAVALPVIGWMAKIVWDWTKDSAVQQHRIGEMEKSLNAHKEDTAATLAALRDEQNSTAMRLVKSEDAIVEIRGYIQRNDEEFSIILLKLEQLPRLSGLLDAWSDTVKQTVPRSEVDNRIAAVERSNQSLQTQVNELHRERREA